MTTGLYATHHTKIGVYLRFVPKLWRIITDAEQLINNETSWVQIRC